MLAPALAIGASIAWGGSDFAAGLASRRLPLLAVLVGSQAAGLALVCPVTNQAKGYPFEVAIPKGRGVAGVILADHLKSVDWKARRAEKLGRSSIEVMNEILAKIAPLLGY